MQGTITIDDALTVLSIIGEEASIGFDKNQKVQDALTVIETAIQGKLDTGELRTSDALIIFE